MRRSMFNGIPIIVLGKRTAPLPYGMQITLVGSGLKAEISPTIGESLMISGITASGTVRLLATIGDDTVPITSGPAADISIDSSDIGGHFDGLTIISSSASVTVEVYGWEVVV